MLKRVACAGAHELTPSELQGCYAVGRQLAEEGITVVTGGAHGADMAFTIGALEAGGLVTVVVPWGLYNVDVLEQVAGRFSKTLSILEYNPTKHRRWETLAKACHPTWGRLGTDGKKFHSRNSGIILGEDIDQIVDCIYAYPTKDRSGNIEQIFRLAEFLRIPIRNMRHES
jgi:hypothetical protein